MFWVAWGGAAMSTRLLLRAQAAHHPPTHPSAPTPPTPASRQLAHRRPRLSIPGRQAGAAAAAPLPHLLPAGPVGARLRAGGRPPRGVGRQRARESQGAQERPARLASRNEPPGLARPGTCTGSWSVHQPRVKTHRPARPALGRTPGARRRAALQQSCHTARQAHSPRLFTLFHCPYPQQPAATSGPAEAD